MKASSRFLWFFLITLQPCFIEIITYKLKQDWLIFGVIFYINQGDIKKRQRMSRKLMVLCIEVMLCINHINRINGHIDFRSCPVNQESPLLAPKFSNPI